MKTWIVVLLALATSCAQQLEDAGGPPPDARDGAFVSNERADGFVVARGSAEADAVLALVNQPIADLAAADDLRILLNTKLHALPAEGIVAYRLGADELPGGPIDDDQTFADLAALDAIPYVGPVALRRLWELADAEGLYTPQQRTVCQNVGSYDQSWPNPWGRGDRVITQNRHLVELHQSGCTKIEGKVRLTVDLPAGQRNLEAFEHIEEIGMLVIERGLGLESLRGLSNVTSIGSLYLDTQELDTLEGLEGLTSIPGSLTVRRAKSLIGLDNVASIGGEIYLANVDDITALSGLNEITSLRAARVTSYDGLHNVTHISGNLSIENYAGQELALDSLIAIDGDFKVEGTTLGGMAGTDALEHVGGTLSLEATDVDASAGFGSLEAVGALLVVQYRQATSDADLSGLSGLAHVGGRLRLELKNDQATVTGLNNIETIEGDLHLYFAEAIGDFDDFGSLTAIGGDLWTPRAMEPDVVDAFVLGLDHFAGDVR